MPLRLISCVLFIHVAATASVHEGRHDDHHQHEHSPDDPSANPIHIRIIMTGSNMFMNVIRKFTNRFDYREKE